MDTRPQDVDLTRFGGTSCDVFRLSWPGTGVDPVFFRAAHGKFALKALDVDEDDLDEIVLEHAVGRGTFVTVRHLQVLKRGERGFQAVLDVQLDDYLWPVECRDPFLLRRQYELLADRPGSPRVLRIELEPVDLGGRPAPTGVDSSLHQVRLDLVYDRALGVFNAVDCVMRPTAAVFAGGRS